MNQLGLFSTKKQGFDFISSKIGGLHERVVSYLLSVNDATNSEISEALEIKISTITPRTNELQKLGRIRKGPARKCSVTGHQARPYYAV